MEHTDIKYFDVEELGTWPICSSDMEFSEAKEKLYQHHKRERNQTAVKLAKELFKIKHNGRMFCEVCMFDFSEKYGDMGEGYIEAHHKKPISKMNPGEKTKLEDFVMVCSNCHSMLHIGQEWISHEELRLRIERANNDTQ